VADRSIVVRLRADISDLRSQMQAGGKAVEGVAKSAEQSGTRARTALGGIGKGLDAGLSKVHKHRDSLNTLGNGFTVLGLAAAGGVGIALKAFAQFDQQMSFVAATGADARSNLDALRVAAVQAGSQTAFSATEAAEGIENLAKAGVSAADTLGGGLKGSLDLAAAGGLDVASAAEIAATALTQFKLAGNQVPHVADLLAAGAGKAQGDVSDLAAALKQSGLVASQMGLSVEDTTGVLASFASAGLLGSDAGTSFKTMLQSLTPNSAAAAAAMEKVGLNAYDAQGKFVGITTVAEQLSTGLGKLTTEQQNATLKVIFGADAVRAATVLYQQGGKGIQEWINQVNDAGYAAITAATRMDNLRGDLDNLGGAFESAFINSGGGANDFLRDLTQDVTGVVNSFNGLPGPVQEGALTFAALSAAGLLAGGGIAKLAVGVANARTSFVNLTSSSPRAASALGRVTKAAGVAAAAFVALQTASAIAQSLSDEVSPSVETISRALIRLGKAAPAAAKSLNDLFSVDSEGFFTADLDQEKITSFAAAADRLFNKTGGQKANDWVAGIVGAFTGLDGITDKLRARFGEVDTVLNNLASSGAGEDAAAGFRQMADELTRQGAGVEDVARLFPVYADSLRSTASQLGVTSLSTQDLVDWMGGKVPPAITAASVAAGAAGKSFQGLPGIIEDTSDRLADLAKAASDAANALLGMREDQIGMQEAVEAADKAIRDNGKTLDIHTEKGKANRRALDGIARGALAYRDSLVEQKASAEQIVAVNEAGRKKFLASADAMGMGAKAARRLADELFFLPKEITSQVAVAGAKLSEKQAKDVNVALRDIPAEKRAEIVTIAHTLGAKAAKAAIDAVKDKEVIARSKGDLSGAKAVEGAMKALRDRLVTARARKDDRAIRELETALRSLRDRTVTITTINRRVTQQVGRDAKLIAPAGGGYIVGPGTGTSDSIPAMVSNGEYVQTAAATAYYGVGFMHALNQRRIRKDDLPAYAAGGLVGFAAGGPVGTVDVGRIMRLIAQALDLSSPVRSADARARRVAPELRRDRRALEAAREDVRDARRAKNKKALEKAEDALEKAEDRHKKTADKAKDAIDALKAAQEALADAARQTAATLSAPYRSESLDVDDQLARLREGAAELGAFGKQLRRLRALGLSEDQIKAISDRGAVAGGEIADQLLAGGKSMVAAFNKANKNLDAAADALGYDLERRKARRHATGGRVIGPGTGTSDSVDIRASNGEYIVNAYATARNLSLLEAINAGHSPRQLVPAYGGGGMVQARREVRTGDVHATFIGQNEDAIMRKLNAAKRDAYTMANLSVAF
jgi:TP901 family phage tail tape measure protein